MVFAAPEKDSLVVEGNWAGVIAGIPRGENGFGYDPLFFVPEEQKTAAELTDERKNQISHRAKAVEKLKDQWENWLNQ